MLEIAPDRKRIKKYVLTMMVTVFALESVFYYIFVVYVGDVLGFYVTLYVLLALLSILILMLVIGAYLPARIVIDPGDGSVKSCVGKRCYPAFNISEVKKLEYYVAKNGTVYVKVYKNGDYPVFSIGSWNFREEDVRRVFEILRSFSEEYGFEVVKLMENERKKGAPDIESDVISSIAASEEPPYRIK